MMDLGIVFLGPTTKSMIAQLAGQLGISLPGIEGGNGSGPGGVAEGIVNLLGGQNPNNDYVQAVSQTWTRILAFEQELYHWYSTVPNPFGDGELQDHWYANDLVDNTDPNLTIPGATAVLPLMDAVPAGMHWYDYRSDYDSDTGDDEALAPLNIAALSWRAVYAGMFLDRSRGDSLRYDFDDDTNNQIYHTFFYAWMMYFTNANLAVNGGNAVHEDEAGGTYPDFMAALGGIYLGKYVREMRNADVDDATKRQYLAALPSVLAAVFAREDLLPPRGITREALVQSREHRSFRMEFVCPGGWYAHPWNGNEMDTSRLVWVSPTEWSNPGGIFTLDLYDRVTEIDRDIQSKVANGHLNPLEFASFGYVFLRKMINDPHDFAQCPETFCLPDRER